jgi:hypothetical protein
MGSAPLVAGIAQFTISSLTTEAYEVLAVYTGSSTDANSHSPAILQFVENVTYDAAAQFSATANPNGTWSYGWSQSRGSAFDVDLQVDYPAAGLPAWISNCCGTIEPDVFHNETDAPISPAGTNLIPAKSLGFHPGPGGQNAVVRWTAPAAGNYTVKATFWGDDFVGPTTTDVAVLHNRLTLYASNVDGYGPSSDQSYSGTVSVQAGDTVDFTVGYGTDGNYSNDTTGLSALITPAD